MSNKKTKSLHRFYPFALTVAGSDSGGGAGIEADLRTFNAFGVFGSCVITAVTAQNPRQVLRVDKMSADSVEAQINAVMSCFSPGFIKTGMLADAKIIEVVARAVEKHKVQLICDPVLGSTSGKSFADDETLAAMRSRLLPLAAWITPNVPEACLLLNDGRQIVSETDLFQAARDLHKMYGADILLKSGHLELPEAADAVCRGGKCYRLTSPKADVPPFGSHGTGCTLSAALTAGLTLEYPWKQALCEAKSFVLGSLSQNVELAQGLWAMYPPTEDCYDLVKLEPVEER